MFGESQQLHFHTFLNAISWVTNADVDERSKAVFYFFTAGKNTVIVFKHKLVININFTFFTVL